MEMAQTPGANRLHIGLFGRTNSGKSTLLNALAGQSVAITSPVAGTTTDPVSRAVEISPIGPCLLTDTAGFDDSGELGELRIARTKQTAQKTDVAILVVSQGELSAEKEWLEHLKRERVSVIIAVNLHQGEGLELCARIREELGQEPVAVNAKTGEGIEDVKQALIRAMPPEFEMQSITGALVKRGDTVLLVMPQDRQAPKGRLILPQVQTIRDLLDHHCLTLCTTLETLDDALAALSVPPGLIITDSQVFSAVYEKKPLESRLTSFSVLFAAYKGDLGEFVEGAAAIDSLGEDSRVLIAEACAHSPLDGDIGREKIPAMLRKKAGQGLRVDVVSGTDFPEDLRKYDLIIHCGACMFNRRYVLARIASAKSQRVPITNYGVAIAKLGGILEKITLE